LIAAAILMLAPALARERLATLFKTHADRLYRLARRLTPGVDDALDLVQETFLRAATSPTTVPAGARPAEAWSVRILVNLRRDQWRRGAIRRRVAPQLRPVHSTHPEGVYVLQVTVWEALDHLSPRRRAILVMHELEGMPVAAIGSLLGVSAITVRWHLARAGRELARWLRPATGQAHAHTRTTATGGGPAPSRRASTP
jgi:RNA polymerase sigma-70 factor (ECF subfamily)